MPTEFQLQESLRKLPVPGLGRSLGEAGMIKGAKVDGPSGTIAIELPTPAFPTEQLTSSILSAVKSQFPDLTNVDVKYSAVVKGKMTGGAIGLKVKNVIAVGSGKGAWGRAPSLRPWRTD